MTWKTIAGLLLLPALAGCFDSPSGAGGPDLVPTLENIWPNADQDFWDFAIEARTWIQDPEGNVPYTLYEQPTDVPAPPTLDDIEARLGDELDVDPTAIESGTCSLHLDGFILLSPVLYVQKMDREIVWDHPLPEPAGFPFAEPVGRLSLHDDLTPEFLGIFEGWDKSELGIICYNTTPDGGYWTYLQADLSKGHEFRHAPVPAEPYFLSGRVLGTTGIWNAVTGQVKNALKVLYMLDTGVFPVENGSGDVLGYSSYVDYGVIIYAPGIGPVRCYERRYVEPGDPDLKGWAEVTLTLTGSSVLD